MHSNAKKSVGNILTGLISQLITLALGIITPRLFLVNLGSEANGLLNSISQILVYVSLLEAGVGTASLQALYGPVATEDKASINAILAATSRFYKRTGRVYLLVVLALTVLFPLTIQSSLPRSDIMLVVFLSGMPGAVSYYFQGKFRLLLQAEGKSYILTNLSTIFTVLASLSKIILLLAGFNVVALQAMYLAFSLIQTALIVLYMKRHYKWLDLSVQPNFDAISQSKNVMLHQVTGLIFSNTDILVLTYACGLSTVSVYAMYTLLFGMISTMIGHFGGVNFILGQTFHADRQRYLKLHDLYEVFNMTLTFCLYCIANIFILPFLSIYTAGVFDVTYVDKYLPYLFIATYLLSNGRSSSSQAITFAQHFKQVQGRAVLETIINLIVSLIGVNYLGIYGVLLGTIAALLYRTNDMILYANRKILHRSPWITYRRWLLNLALFVVVTVAAKYIFSFIPLDTYWQIIFWAVICCIVIIPLFFVVVSIFDRETYRCAKELLSPYFKSFLNKFFRKNRPSQEP